MSTAVVDHIIAAISPASVAHAEGARLRLAAVNLPHVEAVGVALAAAQHSARLRTKCPMVVVVAADHGIADPGVDFGHNIQPRSRSPRSLKATPRSVTWHVMPAPAW